MGFSGSQGRQINYRLISEHGYKHATRHFPQVWSRVESKAHLGYWKQGSLLSTKWLPPKFLQIHTCQDQTVRRQNLRLTYDLEIRFLRKFFPKRKEYIKNHENEISIKRSCANKSIIPSHRQENTSKPLSLPLPCLLTSGHLQIEWRSTGRDLLFPTESQNPLLDILAYCSPTHKG